MNFISNDSSAKMEELRVPFAVSVYAFLRGPAIPGVREPLFFVTTM
jgi:hypothetical protein